MMLTTQYIGKLVNKCWLVQYRNLHYKNDTVIPGMMIGALTRGLGPLTHWGRVTHKCASTLTIIGSDNGLSPGRRQAIIWTTAGILLIGPLGTNFSENLIEIKMFSFRKMHVKMSSAKWFRFCLGLNVLNYKITHLKSIANFCIVVEE